MYTPARTRYSKDNLNNYWFVFNFWFGENGFGYDPSYSMCPKMKD